MDRANVDTDQIVPKQFLKLVSRIGYGKYLFYDWRFNSDGSPTPNFILNDPRYQGASILLARSNFGCGSSREHAVWALQDYGFMVIIAQSYADIFYSNCIKNGVLPVTLPDAEVDKLFNEVNEVPGFKMKVDLEAQTLETSTGRSIHFTVDAYVRTVLLQGLDEITLTMLHEEKIRLHERKNAGRAPFLG
jgi:3-isopropylmalate/(R)-2-methylmalate dehydratase small subunit